MNCNRRRRRQSVYQPWKERERLCQLNEAFNHLQEAMPFIPPRTKLSKIKTLRFAINYIRQLSEKIGITDSSFGWSSDDECLDVSEEASFRELSVDGEDKLTRPAALHIKVEHQSSSHHLHCLRYFE